MGDIAADPPPLQHSVSLADLNPLLGELKKVISELVDTTQGLSNTPKDVHLQSKHQRVLIRLTYILEKILEYGLKDKGIFSSTYYWNYIENLTSCLPGPEATSVIKRVKEFNKGAVGRGRVFIRLALNEGSLEEYLRALIWNPTLTQSYYRETSILRREEQCAALFSMLQSLSTFKFDFVLKDRNLDDQDFWEKLLRSNENRNKLNSSRSAGLLNLDSPEYMGLSSHAITRTSSLPSIETINCIIEQAENQEKELQQTRKNLLELKVQLEMERKEKESVKEAFQFLSQRLTDMEAELKVYKSHCEKLSAVPSAASVAEDESHRDIVAENEALVNEMLKGMDPNAQANEVANALQEAEQKAEALVQNQQVNEISALLSKLEAARQFIQEMKLYDESIKEKLNNIPVSIST